MSPGEVAANVSFVWISSFLKLKITNSQMKTPYWNFLFFFSGISWMLKPPGRTIMARNVRVFWKSWSWEDRSPCLCLRMCVCVCGEGVWLTGTWQRKDIGGRSKQCPMTSQGLHQTRCFIRLMFLRNVILFFKYFYFDVHCLETNSVCKRLIIKRLQWSYVAWISNVIMGIGIKTVLYRICCLTIFLLFIFRLKIVRHCWTHRNCCWRLQALIQRGWNQETQRRL